MTACLSSLMVLGWHRAMAQPAFPVKPIRIVASEAGGGGDFSSRVIAQALGPMLEQTVIVENRPGGVFAGDFVAKSPPDGYTLLHYGNTFWLLPLMRDRVPYDPLKDFLPVALTVRAISILVIHPSVPVKTTKELIALAKLRPGDLNYGSAAVGSSNHLAAEQFKAMTKVNIVRVPFKGVGSALNALMSGDVQLMFPLIASGMPHVQSGRLKMLAVGSAEPSELAPGLPTVASAGLPGFDASGTYGIFAPARTPNAVISRLHQEIASALKKPEIRDRLAKAGMESVGGTPEQIAALMRGEITSIGRIIRDAGIREQ